MDTEYNLYLYILTGSWKRGLRNPNGFVSPEYMNTYYYIYYMETVVLAIVVVVDVVVIV